MPKYTARIIVPASTTQSDPETVNLKVSQGRIAQVSVAWTPGSEWLNCFRALSEGAQIIPSEGGGFCRGNGYPDVWPEHIMLRKSHPTLNLEAWSEGNNYEQEVLISIVVLPEAPDLMKPVRDLVAIFKKVMRL